MNDCKCNICHYICGYIVVLSNMALFGTALWWFTRDNLIARLGVLAGYW